MAGNKLSDSYWWNWLGLVWTWSQTHATFCHISGLGSYLTARYLTRSAFFSCSGKVTASLLRAGSSSSPTKALSELLRKARWTIKRTITVRPRQREFVFKVLKKTRSCGRWFAAFGKKTGLSWALKNAYSSTKSFLISFGKGACWSYNCRFLTRFHTKRAPIEQLHWLNSFFSVFTH